MNSEFVGRPFSKVLSVVAEASLPISTPSIQPMGGSMWVGFYDDPLTFLHDGSVWIKSGYSVLGSDYPEALKIPHLQLFGNSTLPISNKRITSIVVVNSFIKLISCSDGTVFRTTDGEISWNVIEGLSLCYLTKQNNVIMGISNSTSVITFSVSNNFGEAFQVIHSVNKNGLTANSAIIANSNSVYAAGVIGDNNLRLSNGTSNAGTLSVGSNISNTFRMDNNPSGGVIYCTGKDNRINVTNAAISQITLTLTVPTGNIVSFAVNVLGLTVINDLGEVWLFKAFDQNQITKLSAPNVDNFNLKIKEVSSFENKLWFGCVDKTSNYFVPKTYSLDEVLQWKTHNLSNLVLTTTTAGAPVINNGFIYVQGVNSLIRQFTSIPKSVGKGEVITLGTSTLAWRIR